MDDIKEGFSRQLLSSYLDSTLLKADVTEADVLKLCSEAIENKFKAVCVAPFWVPTVCDALIDTDVKICTVVNFPLGNNFYSSADVATFLSNLTISKIDEYDIVLPPFFIKEAKYKRVLIDGYLNACTQALHDSTEPKIIKLIIETALLSKAEIEEICVYAMKWRIDFIKTSTGFSTRGASVADIEIIRNIVGDACKIKASAGIKTFKQTKELIQAGADRIGTSNAVQIVKEWDELKCQKESTLPKTQ